MWLFAIFGLMGTFQLVQAYQHHRSLNVVREIQAADQQSDAQLMARSLDLKYGFTVQNKDD